MLKKKKKKSRVQNRRKEKEGNFQKKSSYRKTRSQGVKKKEHG